MAIDIHVYIYIYVYIYIHLCTELYIFAHAYITIYLCINICIHAYIYIYLCIHTYMFLSQTKNIGVCLVGRLAVALPMRGTRRFNVAATERRPWIQRWRHRLVMTLNL